MKKTLFLVLLQISILKGFSQEDGNDNNPVQNGNEIQTIFGNPDVVTAYCAFTGKYGEMYELPTWDLGMRIGAVIDHWFALGIAGYGTMQAPLYNPDLQDEYAIHGGYGGIYFEPIFFPKFPAHLSFPVLIGGGSMKYDLYDENNSYSDSDTYQGNPFWVVEPGIELELNLFKHFRLAFGGHYRITSPLSFEFRQKDALNGLTGSISLKFGAF